MELLVLDIRNNQMSNIVKINSKFLKKTMVLAWDNGCSKRVIEGYLQKTKNFTGLQSGSNVDQTQIKVGNDFNPFFLMSPNED
jgi:hypothetical protein